MPLAYAPGAPGTHEAPHQRRDRQFLHDPARNIREGQIDATIVQHTDGFERTAGFDALQQCWEFGGEQRGGANHGSSERIATGRNTQR